MMQAPQLVYKMCLLAAFHAFHIWVWSIVEPCRGVSSQVLPGAGFTLQIKA